MSSVREAVAKNGIFVVGVDRYQDVRDAAASLVRPAIAHACPSPPCAHRQYGRCRWASPAPGPATSGINWHLGSKSTMRTPWPARLRTDFSSMRRVKVFPEPDFSDDGEMLGRNMPALFDAAEVQRGLKALWTASFQNCLPFMIRASDDVFEQAAWRAPCPTTDAVHENPCLRLCLSRRPVPCTRR